MNLTDTARTPFENLTLDEERALYGITCATVKGEYLGWYSEGLTLVRCRIEADSVGEIVYDRAPVDGTGCEIVTRN